MSKGQTVAYLRVSTTDQHLDRQQDLRDEADRVFEEFASGSTRARPQLDEALAYLRDGDTLVVWSMDRLARNARDLQDIVSELNARGVTVTFRQESLSFRPSHSDPMSHLLLQIMGAYAEFERSIMLARQAEGIAKAKARGAYKGRKALLTPEQAATARERVEAGVSKARVARDLGVSRATVYRALTNETGEAVR